MRKAESTQQKREKMKKELQKWKQEAARPKPTYYLVFLVIILAFVYITDEITSNITNTVQSSVINEFFVAKGVDYNTGLSNLSFMMMPAYVFYLILPFYKSLADRLGRKLFLVINTLGMALGMFAILISPNVYTYILGYLMMYFFIPNDMQVMYIMESAPEAHRAKLCSFTKACGYIGVSSISLLRLVMMGNDPTKWHSIFIVPVILGVTVSILCVLFVRETPVFVEQRISYLERELSGEENVESGSEIKAIGGGLKEKEVGNKPRTKADGKPEEKMGVFSAIRFIFTHKQTRWITIAALIFAFAASVTSYYESIMTTGGMTTADVTKALFIFPLINALITLGGGFLSDRLGRKRSMTVLSVTGMVMLALFVISSGLQVNPYLVGVFYGVFVGCFWSVSDLLYLILPGESVPTRLRASVLGSLSLVFLIGTACSMLFISTGIRFVPSIGMVCLTVCIPFMLISLLLVLSKVNETKGTDMEKITGEEWEK